MSDTKIVISVLAKSVPPPRKRAGERAPTLEERVEYAIGCIECEAPQKQQAIVFLRKAHNHLVQLDHPTKEQQQLVERIKPVLGEYGTEHLEPKESEEK